MEYPSTSSAINICELCNKHARLYTCPRCGIGYCGIECYKSDAHTDCSESFYKQCVEDELKSQENNLKKYSDLRKNLRKDMMDMLKRVHYGDLGDDILEEDTDGEDSSLDSDDEQELPDLEVRLQNVNLDDPNKLWLALSNTERQEFEAFVKNGEAEKLLPKWTPWWTQRVEKKLIQPIEQDAADAGSNLKYPVLIDVPLFNELQKASPCVCFNMINVIYAYAYIALYYNGDYLDCAEDAAKIFLRICLNMMDNKVFNDAESAIQSIMENVKYVDWLPQDKQTFTALREAGASILQGPAPEMKTVYTSAALSELYRLLAAAKKEISISKNTNDQQFTRKFSQKTNLDITLSKKTILLCLKKLEYYLSWVKSHEAELQSIVCD